MTDDEMFDEIRRLREERDSALKRVNGFDTWISARCTERTSDNPIENIDRAIRLRGMIVIDGDGNSIALSVMRTTELVQTLKFCERLLCALQAIASHPDKPACSEYAQDVLDGKVIPTEEGGVIPDDVATD